MNVIPNPRTIAVVTIAALVLLSTFAAIPVAAQDDGPAPVPHSFHGEVFINGEPAPAGTQIVAEIDGEERGELVTDEEGVYGDATIGGDKLIVEGENGDEGAEITFLVDGVEAEQTATYQDSGNSELHLYTGEEPEDMPEQPEDGDEPPAPPAPGDDDDEDAGDASDDGADDGDENDDASDDDSSGNGAADDDSGDTNDDSSGTDDASDDSSATEDDDSLPGFGAVGALVGLLTIAVLAGRRP